MRGTTPTESASGQRRRPCQTALIAEAAAAAPTRLGNNDCCGGAAWTSARMDNRQSGNGKAGSRSRPTRRVARGPVRMEQTN
jgi:hypothetical protein